MTTSAETPNGVNATAEPANAAPAQPASPANVGPAPDDDDEIRNVGDLRRLRRRFERRSEELSTVRAELEAIKAREAQAKSNEHLAEFERLKKLEQDMKTQQAEQAREAIRKRNADAILSDTKPEQRETITRLLAGMQALGEIDLYQEAEDAGVKLREKMGKDHPEWFSSTPNGGAMPGIPGQGLPAGPLLGQPTEVLEQMDDAAFKAYLDGRRSSGAARP